MNRRPSYDEIQDLLAFLTPPSNPRKVVPIVDLFSNYQAVIAMYEHCFKGLVDAAIDYLQQPDDARVKALVTRILATEFGVLPAFYLGVINPDDQKVFVEAKQTVGPEIDAAMEKALAQQETLFACLKANAA